MTVNLCDRADDVESFLSTARKNAKQNKCLICGEKTTNLCKSHFVPKFCLKNIADIGYVYNNRITIDHDVIGNEVGVQKAGTFQLICRDCDSNKFLNYEDSNNYNNEPTQKMMAEIAMKNYLKYISKRLIEIEGCKILHEKHSFDVDRAFNAYKQDLKWYKNLFNLAYERALGYDSSKYELLFFKKLEYVVPIAFQSRVALIYDLDGNVVNDVYNMKTTYHIWDLHICIFPFKNSSVILMFADTYGLKRYSKFINKFEQLSDSDKLELINYIIFLYSEDMFLSKKIPTKIFNEGYFKKVNATGADDTNIKLNGVDIHGERRTKLTDKTKNEYDLNIYKKIPNLLSYEYRFNNEADNKI